jgi:GH25 family lysozyme M1 (1,4-beta-N-acetylmuramidase)
VLAAVAFLGLLGAPAVMASAATAASAGPPAGASGEPHFNVGAPHSPRLLRELAGPRGASGRGARAGAVPTGPPGAVRGVDVAAFQHPMTKAHPKGTPIDWSRVVADGIRFAAVKATEGNYYVNPFYAGDLAGASAAGLPVLGYAFANPKSGNGTAAGQARYLVRHAGTVGGRTPPLMLDIEYNPYRGGECYGRSKAAMVTWLTSFDAEARKLTGQVPVLYTTGDWWHRCTGDSAALGASPLWVASYTTHSRPAMPKGWGDWALWQYTSTATVPGIDPAGRTDLDALNLIAPGPQETAIGMSVSVPVSQAVTGAAPGLSYTAAGLPAGLAVNPGGVVAGTPTMTDAAQASTVTAAAEGQVLGSIGVTWEVGGALSVTPPAGQQTAAGNPVLLTVPRPSVPAGQTVSFTAAGLPPGLTISAAGQIAGWPGRPGRYHVTVIAADSLKDMGEASFTWTVTPVADHGRAGPVRSQVRRRCLNDPGETAKTGTRIGVVSCDGRDAQRWALAQDGTLRIRGRCLSVIGSAGPGAVADLGQCSGAARQQWTVRTGGELANGVAGRCLTAPRPGHGTAARIEACAGSASQQWLLPPGPVVSQIPGGCLDDPGNRTARHTAIQVWPCAGDAAQNWTALPDRAVQIHGQCLQARPAGAASGRPVELDPCTGGAAQRWTISAGGTGMQLRNPSSGRCLTDTAPAGSTFAAHPVAVTGPCGGSRTSTSRTATSWQFR